MEVKEEERAQINKEAKEEVGKERWREKGQGWMFRVRESVWIFCFDLLGCEKCSRSSPILRWQVCWELWEREGVETCSGSICMNRSVCSSFVVESVGITVDLSL